MILMTSSVFDRQQSTNPLLRTKLFCQGGIISYLMGVFLTPGGLALEQIFNFGICSCVISTTKQKINLWGAKNAKIRTKIDSNFKQNFGYFSFLKSVVSK